MQRKSEVTPKGELRSDLHIKQVNRAHHLRSFSCQAQNNNQQRPLTQEVTIDMNCEWAGVGWVGVSEWGFVSGWRWVVSEWVWIGL